MNRKLSGPLAIIMVFLSLFLLVPHPALATSDQVYPRLGTHTFIPNSFLRGPFINSYIGNGVGFGGTNSVNVPAITLPDSTVLLNLDTGITVAVLMFDWQHAMKSWVGFRTHFEVFGRLGSTTDALLAEGITGVGTFELGWIFKLAEGKRDFLSLDLSMQRNQGSFINLVDWLKRIIEDGGLKPDNTLVRNRDSLRGIVGLSYAHAFSSRFGLTAQGDLGYGEKIDRNGENDLKFDVRAGLSFNLHDTTNVPLGVFLGSGLSNWSKGGEILRGDIASGLLQIDFMGFDDFTVGLQYSYERLPLSGIDDSLVASAALITLQYFY